MGVLESEHVPIRVVWIWMGYQKKKQLLPFNKTMIYS